MASGVPPVYLFYACCLLANYYPSSGFSHRSNPITHTQGFTSHPYRARSFFLRVESHNVENRLITPFLVISIPSRWQPSVSISCSRSALTSVTLSQIRAACFGIWIDGIHFPLLQQSGSLLFSKYFDDQSAAYSIPAAG